MLLGCSWSSAAADAPLTLDRPGVYGPNTSTVLNFPQRREEDTTQADWGYSSNTIRLIQ
jgi:hypothetical protein